MAERHALYDRRAVALSCIIYRFFYCFIYGNGIIAVNLENTAGSVTLEGNYIELISGRVLSGNVSVMPYEVLVLKKTD